MPWKEWTEMGQGGSQETIEEDIAIVQAREDDGKDFSDGCGSRRQWARES